jgi:hypothetical protein
MEAVAEATDVRRAHTLPRYTLSRFSAWWHGSGSRILLVLKTKQANEETVTILLTYV